MGDVVHRLMNYRLTRIAQSQKRKIGIGDSLPTAELVDDAVLRLLRANGDRWNDRFHILAVAAKAIEQLALNHRKRKRAKKRGGGARIGSLSKADPIDAIALEEAEHESVHDALVRLENQDARMALVIRLRTFGEMTFTEIANELELTDKTVRKIYRSGLERLHGDLQNEFR